MTYHDLCAGLEMYLKQVDSEPTARWAHFRFLGTLRPPTTKDLEYQIGVLERGAQRYFRWRWCFG